MTIARTRTPETGAVYVEAAIIMPVLLLVVFASLFFMLVAARHFSLQMLASEIAKDAGLALDPRAGVNPGSQGSCIQKTCTYRQFNADELRVELVNTLRSWKWGGTPPGCWKQCAQSQYLLDTTTNGLTLTLTSYPSLQWFDTTSPTSYPPYAAVGDYIGVELQYPLSSIFGGNVPMFGYLGNIRLVGTAITVLERPGSEALEDY